jgi:hypothetical protein
MRQRRLGARIRASVVAALAGWAAAVAATLPMEFAKILGNTFVGPWAMVRSLAEGLLIWGAWCLAIAAGGWLVGLVPVALLVPEERLLRHRRACVAAGAILGWIVVLLEFRAWKLLLPYHYLQVRMFVIYSFLLVIYTTVSALVYLRWIARGRPSSD